MVPFRRHVLYLSPSEAMHLFYSIIQKDCLQDLDGAFNPISAFSLIITWGPAGDTVPLSGILLQTRLTLCLLLLFFFSFGQTCVFHNLAGQIGMFPTHYLSIITLLVNTRWRSIANCSLLLLEIIFSKVYLPTSLLPTRSVRTVLTAWKYSTWSICFQNSLWKDASRKNICYLPICWSAWFLLSQLSLDALCLFIYLVSVVYTRPVSLKEIVWWLFLATSWVWFLNLRPFYFLQMKALILR